MERIATEECSFLKSFTSVLAIKAFIRGKYEHYALVSADDSSGSPYISCEHEMGTSAVDFMYDSLYEMVVGFLAETEVIVSNIKRDDREADWGYFERLARYLYYSENMHPFYYPLFVEIINAYKRNMCDAEGKELRNDHFAKIGEELSNIKKRISDLLNAHDKLEDNSTVIDCYRENAFPVPLLITNIQAELLPTKAMSVEKESYELVMVLVPQKLEEIWNYLLSVYVSSGIRFKRCENCKRFFATNGRGNPKFCERIIEGKDKSCRQLMPKLNFLSKAEKDPAVWLYNRAYKTMYSRVTVGAMRKELFKEWSKEARAKRDECSRGDISPEQYSEWLCNNGLFIDYLKET